MAKKSDDDSEDSFYGFSDTNELDDSSDSDSGPEVVKFDDSSTTTEKVDHTDPAASKRERKLFMSSTAPREKIQEPPAPRKKQTKEDQESLENDVALQRMINESHILAEGREKLSGADISTDFDPIGKTRHKTLNSRIESLGGFADRNSKQRAPMNIQKGINAKKQERKEKQEKHAKEAGIVLARPTSSINKQTPVKRDRGLKIASVGKSTKHGLVISEKDRQKVTGAGGGGDKGGGRKKKKKQR